MVTPVILGTGKLLFDDVKKLTLNYWKPGILTLGTFCFIIDWWSSEINKTARCIQLGLTSEVPKTSEVFFTGIIFLDWSQL